MLADLKLYGTYLGVIIPPIGSAYSAFLLKQAFESVPKEYEEAARIDGAGRFTTLFRILMPIAAPAIITVGLFNFVWTWNNFAWPLFVSKDIGTYNLVLTVYTFTVGYHRIEPVRLAAGNVLCTIVPLIVYIVGLKYFLKGIVLAGLKK